MPTRGQVEADTVGRRGADPVGDEVERVVPRHPREAALAPRAAPSGARAGRARAAHARRAAAARRRRRAAPSSIARAVLTFSRSRRVVQRCTPLIVQSWKPATPSAQPSHTPLRRMRHAYGRSRRLSQTVLRHGAVVVRLLLADAVGLPTDPELAPRADRRSCTSVAPRRASRPARSCVEVDALGVRVHVEARRRAGSRRPSGRSCSAAATARLDGADTAHSTGMPGDRRLLHELERQPARHEQHVVGERQRAARAARGRSACRARCAGRRLRATATQLAVGGEARRRVQPAGLVEHPLVRGRAARAATATTLAATRRTRRPPARTAPRSRRARPCRRSRTTSSRGSGARARRRRPAGAAAR